MIRIMEPKKTKLGNSDLVINRLGLGCMGMSEFYGSFNEEESIKTLHAAVELGVNFFDTADMYGSGLNEKLLGQAFKEVRHKIVLATKFGIMRGENGEFSGINGRPEYIKKACDKSLMNLNMDSIDLYYMHRLDPEVPIEEIAGAMKDLVQAGKIRYLGLSEVDEDTSKRAHAVHPISALQTEYSLWSREPENGILDLCDSLGVTFVSYSPLGRGFLTGNINKRSDLEPGDWRLDNPRFSDEALEKNKHFVEVINGIAKSKKGTNAQVALAWVLSQSDKIAAIPGTRKIERLKENLGAFDIVLTESDLQEINNNIPTETIGARY